MFQIAKFLGGESSPLVLEQDPSGVFISRLEVDRIEADSGDTYGCQPNPGLAAEVKVHVIKEGTFKIVNVTFIFKTNYFRYNAHCTEYELTTPAI